MGFLMIPSTSHSWNAKSTIGNLYIIFSGSCSFEMMRCLLDIWQ